jgi:hypothetical protein
MRYATLINDKLTDYTVVHSWRKTASLIILSYPVSWVSAYYDGKKQKKKLLLSPLAELTFLAPDHFHLTKQAQK